MYELVMEFQKMDRVVSKRIFLSENKHDLYNLMGHLMPALKKGYKFYVRSVDK